MQDSLWELSCKEVNKFCHKLTGVSLPYQGCAANWHQVIHIVYNCDLPAGVCNSLARATSVNPVHRPMVTVVGLCGLMDHGNLSIPVSCCNSISRQYRVGNVTSCQLWVKSTSQAKGNGKEPCYLFKLMWIKHTFLVKEEQQCVLNLHCSKKRSSSSYFNWNRTTEENGAWNGILKWIVTSFTNKNQI